MSPEDWEQISNLYHAALKLKPSQRSKYLDEACGGNEKLRKQVERLLASQKETLDFLEEPAINMVARSLTKDDIIPENIGSYRILNILGEGGMGIVYLAEQEEPIRRRVAIKVVKLGMATKDVIARFESERQTLAIMNHPNIANVLDAGTTDQGLPYFVMEFVDGVSISEYCDCNRLNTRERLELFMPVCQAVHHAHQKGIIHRDIKPSNVLVIEKDDKPIPKIIDFGVAKATNQRLTEKSVFTQHGILTGTPEYMSPEQAEITCLDVDMTTDIYSLGVVLYELLAGALPYDPRKLRRAGYSEIQRILREDEPQTPAMRFHALGYAARQIAEFRHTDIGSLERQLRGDLNWIVMKAMEKDRTRRYQSANELKEDINRYLKDEAVLAHPKSAAYRLGKFIKKNRVLVASIASIFIILTIASTISIGLWLRADRARKESERRLTVLHEEEGHREFLQGNTLLAATQLNEAFQAGANDASLRFWLAESMRSLDSQIAILRGHSDKVNSVIFSPDGRYLATSSDDKTARLWNALNGSLIEVLGGHQGAVRSVLFSPDGSLVLTAGFENVLRVWSVPDGKLQRKFECPAPISSAVFSPDGTRIATGSTDNKARLWDVRSGRLLETFEGHSYRPSIIFSPDGSRIVTAGGLDGTAMVWDLSRHRSLFTIDTQPTPIYSIGFSRDGSKIVTAANTIRIWNSNTGRLISSYQASLDHNSATRLSSDSSRAATYGGSEGIRVLDIGNGSLLASVDRAWGSPYFSPDGSQIITADAKGTLRLYNLASGWLTLSMQGHKGRVNSVAFNSSGSMVATAGTDGTARLWDISKTPLRSSLKVGRGVSLTAFSPDGSRILTSLFPSKSAELWDIAGGKLIASLIGHSGQISTAAFSSDGSKILTTCPEDWGPILWESQSGKRLAFLEGHTAPVFNARFDSSGSHVVTASADATAGLWDTSRAQLLKLFKGHTKAVNDACFSPNGRLVATASADKTAKVWDVNTGQLVFSLGDHPAGVNSVVFNPQGSIIATTSGDTAKLWDANSGKLLSSISDNMRPVLPGLDTIFNPSGDRILTFGWDRTGKMWDATTGKLLYVLEVGSEGPENCAFSRDGSLIVATGDGVRIWDASNGQLITTFSSASPLGYGEVLSPDGNAILRIGNGWLLGIWRIQLESRNKGQIANIISRFGESR